MAKNILAVSNELPQLLLIDTEQFQNFKHYKDCDLLLV